MSLSPPVSTSPPTVQDAILRMYEFNLRMTLRQLRRNDDPDFFAFEVLQAECRQDALKLEQQNEVMSPERAALFKGCEELGVAQVRGARDRQARFSADPQRYIEERRLELTKQIAELHDKIAERRQSLGLPPLPFPLERQESKEILSPPSSLTPSLSSATTTVTSSLHKRRMQPYTS